MDRARYEFLMKNYDEKLTQTEIDEGFFFCCTFDGLLIHKTDEEAKYCGCLKAEVNNGP